MLGDDRLCVQTWRPVCYLLFLCAQGQASPVVGEEAGRDSVLTETLAGYLATVLAGSDGEAKLAAVW